MSNKLLDQNGVETLIELVKQKLKHQNEDCYTKDEVNALLNRKQNKLTIDGTLTSNSLNPVTSKGIYQEVAKKVNSSAIASVATSGDYNDLKNKPAIPTKVSELQQDVPETDPTVPNWAKQPTKPSYDYSEINNVPIIPDISDLTTQDYVNNLISGTVTNANYDSSEKIIYFKNGDTVLSQIDATAFIKDGMVSNVEITNGNLVITFNTDSGRQPINIPITSFFNANNYYDKTTSDARFVKISDLEEITNSEIDEIITI